MAKEEIKEKKAEKEPETEKKAETAEKPEAPESPDSKEQGKDEKPAVTFLPPEYSWKTYGAMNVAFWRKHRTSSLERAQELLCESHKKVMSLIEKYSNEELFTKKYFGWTGGTDLGSYFVSTTSSHYDWAIKKIKAHKKNCAE